jgi:hypothetical protein
MQILISGLVTVFVRSSDEQKKYHRVTRAAVDGSDARALMEQGLITFGVPVATLKPGATFGELCLIEPDSKRSATVVVDAAAQVANFIVLTAASYLRLTRSQTIEGTITDHIAFLQHTLLFRKWSKMRTFYVSTCPSINRWSHSPSIKTTHPVDDWLFICRAHALGQLDEAAHCPSRGT